MKTFLVLVAILAVSGGAIALPTQDTSVQPKVYDPKKCAFSVSDPDKTAMSNQGALTYQNAKLISGVSVVK